MRVSTVPAANGDAANDKAQNDEPGKHDAPHGDAAKNETGKHDAGTHDAASDDAFRWEGDEEERATRPRRRRAAEAVSAQTASVATTGTATDADSESASDIQDAPAAGSVGIVLLGIFGGIALLETIGWIRADLRLPLTTDVSVAQTATTTLASLVEILGRIAAVVAAPLWFALVLWRIPPVGAACCGC